MNILVIGTGGREHALCYSLSRSDKVDKIFVYPGNPGINIENKCETIEYINQDELLEFAIKSKIDLVVIGPEQYLIEGWADSFRDAGILVFGPGRKEAELEGSKAFSKEFMKKYGVATALYEVFKDIHLAKKYIESNQVYPIVIKASGLCAGKGVVIAENKVEALLAIDEMMGDKIFDSAGDTIVIEEFLNGKETSILSIYDGKEIHPLTSAMDHKKIFDGEKGPNTGGMGTVSPSPYYSKDVESDFINNILKPTLNGMLKEGFKDPACIFFGLMITDSGVKLLEYNMRFGDPETQVVLARLKGDLANILLSASKGETKINELVFSDEMALCVIGAAPGYPGKIEKGIELNLPQVNGLKIFYAGVGLNDNKLVSTGGRIFGITATGNTKEDIKELTSQYFEKYVPSSIHYRKDIGNV